MKRQQILDKLSTGGFPYSQMQELTKALAEFADLSQNPFQEVLDRNIPISDKVSFKNKKILITGGYGFVGTNLYTKLLKLGVEPNAIFRVAHCDTDVADYSDLKKVFEQEQPDIVFHLAAQRLPGLAETLVRQTTKTCISGAINIITLCEKYNVEKCIFSSTGKASRYYTPDIYAGSKKIAEWLFATQEDTRCKYGIVRFTHIVENSPVSAEFDRRIKEQDVLTLHAPDRFIYAQNVSEAVALLLNATTLVDNLYPKLFAAAEVGWPVNTLDIALYKLQQKDIPIQFTEVPKGYEVGVYLGHIDRGLPNPMLNVLETCWAKKVCNATMLESEIAAFDEDILLNGLCGILSNNENQIRTYLKKTIHATADSQFNYADKNLVNKILEYGKEEWPHPIQCFIIDAISTNSKRSLFSKDGKIQISKFNPELIQFNLNRIKEIDDYNTSLEDAEIITRQLLRLEFNV